MFGFQSTRIGAITACCAMTFALAGCKTTGSAFSDVAGLQANNAQAGAGAGAGGAGAGAGAGGGGGGVIPGVVPVPGIFQTSLAIPASANNPPINRLSNGPAQAVLINNVSSAVVDQRTDADGVIIATDVSQPSVNIAGANALLPSVVNAPNLPQDPNTNYTTDAQRYSLGNSFVAFTVPDDNTAAQRVAGSMGFGYIAERNGNALNIAGFHVGDETAVNNMPTVGTANYLGSVTGQRVISNNLGQAHIGEVEGTILVQANFTAGRIEGWLGAFDNPELPQSTVATANNLDQIQFYGAIDRNTFSATAEYVDDFGGVPVATTTDSAVTGQFYGNGARELGGSIRLESETPGQRQVFVGAFGGVMNEQPQVDISP